MDDLVLLESLEGQGLLVQEARLAQLDHKGKKDPQGKLYEVKQENQDHRDLQGQRDLKGLLAQGVNPVNQADLVQPESQDAQDPLDHLDQEELQELLAHLVHWVVLVLLAQEALVES
jgi:hypothetical protein